MLGHLHQLMNRLGLELGEVHLAARLRQLSRTDDFAVVGVEGLRLVHHLVLPATVVAPVAVAVSVPHAAATTRDGVLSADYGPDFLSSLSQVAVQEGRELRISDTAPTFWASTVPFLKRMRCGNPADAELGRRLGVLVDVQFGHFDLVAVLGGDLVQDGRDHLAGAAPFGPEIQQHGLLGLQDVLGERGIRGVHDMRATHAV